MTIDIAKTLLIATKKVTRRHTRQMKREERDSRARLNRRDVYRCRKIYVKEILFGGMLEMAYDRASNGGKLPAHQRQVFYVARELWTNEYPDRNLEWKTFCQYLADYQDEYEKNDWRIIKDARGKLIEPHTKLSVPLGTIEVDDYLSKSFGRVEEELRDSIDIKLEYPTAGPENRFGAVLFIEKEGFNVILDAAGIPEKYDIAIASSKGQSVVAMRRLADEFCGDIPLLIVRDFDKAGFSIAEKLVTDSKLYRFRHRIKWIDLGLRLADVEKYGLSSEPVRWEGNPPRRATPAEIAFLRSGRRVELNAFTSPQFIEWIEAKLKANKITKVIPNRETLEQAYRRVLVRAGLQDVVDEAIDELTDRADVAKVPKTLEKMIRSALKADPSKPWDKVLAELVKTRNANNSDG